MVSASAGHLLVNYRRAELERRIKEGNPVPGYTIEQMQTAVEFLAN